jgi:hypothetical protein
LYSFLTASHISHISPPTPPSHSVRSTNDEDPHYAVVSSLLLIRTSYIQLLAIPCSRAPSMHHPSLHMKRPNFTPTQRSRIRNNLYCDVHAVGLRSRRYLVKARPLNNVKATFSMWSDPRLY